MITSTTPGIGSTGRPDTVEWLTRLNSKFPFALHHYCLQLGAIVFDVTRKARREVDYQERALLLVGPALDSGGIADTKTRVVSFFPEQGPASTARQPRGAVSYRARRSLLAHLAFDTSVGDVLRDPRFERAIGVIYAPSA